MIRAEHVNIVVEDRERSLAFYVGLLGMRATLDTVLEGAWIGRVSRPEGVKARCVFCGPSRGGVRFERLQFLSPPGAARFGSGLANSPGLHHVALGMDDIDAWHSRLSVAGVSFLSPPVQVPFPLPGNIQKRLCYLRDPDGVILELAEYGAAE